MKKKVQPKKTKNINLKSDIIMYGVMIIILAGVIFGFSKYCELIKNDGKSFITTTSSTSTTSTRTTTTTLATQTKSTTSTEQTRTRPRSTTKRVESSLEMPTTPNLETNE